MEILSWEEKQRFVEILLIIAGIMAAFNANFLLINYFVTFTIFSILYIILVVIAKKKSAIPGFTGFTVYFNIANWFVSIGTAFFFTSILFYLGFLSAYNTTENKNIALYGWLVIYFGLGFVILAVLALKDKK